MARECTSFAAPLLLSCCIAIVEAYYATRCHLRLRQPKVEQSVRGGPKFEVDLLEQSCRAQESKINCDSLEHNRHNISLCVETLEVLFTSSRYRFRNMI